MNQSRKITVFCSQFKRERGREKKDTENMILKEKYFYIKTFFLEKNNFYIRQSSLRIIFLYKTIFFKKNILISEILI